MNTIFWGLIFMLIGGWIWLGNLGIIKTGFRFSRDWPVILIIIGLAVLLEGMERILRRRR